MTRIRRLAPVHALHPAPLEPPCWATSSIPEDGAITHERIASVHPTVRWWTGHGWAVTTTDVSLSTVDTPTEHGWHRPTPTIQIEGGSYTDDGLQQLNEALDELLALVPDTTTTSTPDAPELVALPGGSDSQDDGRAADEVSERGEAD